MPHKKKQTLKQIKKAAAKKAGRTKHQLSHMEKCISTAKLYENGLSAMEIAVEQRRRLDDVRKDLRDFFTKGDPLELKNLPFNFQVLEIARRRIAEGFSQQNIQAAKEQVENIISSVQEGIQQTLTKSPLGSGLPKIPPTLRGRGRGFRE